MTEKLVKEISLENGLVLKLYDGSKKVAGDRWQVSLIARTEITVTGLLTNDDERSSADIDEIEKALGERVTFEQKRERNFIDETRKDEMFEELCASLSDSSLSYLSHPDFPKRFVIKEYKAHKNRQILYPR